MRRRVLGGALAVLALTAVAPATAPARGFTTGFYDGVLAQPDGEGAQWRARAAAVGARLVRTNAVWRDVAPAQPPGGFQANRHEDPAYRWERLDERIRALSAGGFRILLTIDRAPRWAEGPGRPGSAPPGTWRPSPPKLADFATAVARRYSGRTPDPLAPGAFLPRVRDFQLWNEPNLDTYLTPQWRRGRPASPAHFRRMLRAFAPAVRAVSRSNRVITGGTAPFGDLGPGGRRIQPVRFVREVLCLDRRLRSRGCAGTLRFDVLAHHPYSVGRPRRKALNRDDASIPDVHKLGRVLRAARRAGEIAKMPRLWATEISYDSSPPDPDGVPAARHARWLQEAFMLLWKQRVEAVTWLLVRDAAPHPSFDASYQSGVFFRDGRPKPAAHAFRFPFAVERAGRRAVRVWTKAPIAGRLVVERRRGSAWRRVASFEVRAGQVVFRRVGVRPGTALRARIGDDASLTWR